MTSLVSNNTFQKVYHFDSKATIEAYIRTLNLPTTFLYPGFYMNNLPGQRFSLFPTTNKWRLSLPFPITTRIPLFAAEYDTGKFVKSILLNRESMLGKRILAATAYITPLEMLDDFKASFPEAGKDAEVEEMQMQDWKAMLSRFGMPQIGVEDFADMMGYFGQFGYFGGEELEESLAVSFLSFP